MPILMTYEIAQACALDAANAQMRKSGRKTWSLEDRNLAAETFQRLYPIEEHLAQLQAASFQPPSETAPPKKRRKILTVVWPEWDPFANKGPWILRVLDGSADSVRHPPEKPPFGVNPAHWNPGTYQRRFKTGLDAYRWAEKHGYRLQPPSDGSPAVRELLDKLRKRLAA